MPDKKAEWQKKLSLAREDLLGLLEGLSLEAWQVPVYSEGDTWTVAHLVAHLIDSERGMSIHIHKIRQGQKTIPADFDLERWNAGLKKRMGEDLPPSQLLEKLSLVRERTLDEMEKLEPQEWTLTGRHPQRGIITIEQYYETIYGHELMHKQDIQTALAL